MKNNLLKLSLISIIIMGITGCSSKQGHELSNHKYKLSYPRYEKEIKTGGYVLKYGYNIIVSFPKNKHNINKLKNVLNIAYNKFNNKFPNGKINMMSDTSLRFSNKLRKNNAISAVRYYLKADNKYVYLVEGLGLIRGNRTIARQYYASHNILIDILSEDTVLESKEKIMVNDEDIISNYININVRRLK